MAEPSMPPRQHLCHICGAIVSYGYGPPGWPAPDRWFCLEHREVAERERPRGFNDDKTVSSNDAGKRIPRL
jgi:hypothetical protein